MAIIKCSECGKNVSDRASVCPNCGCPIYTDQKGGIENIGKTKKRKWKIIFFILIFLLVSSFILNVVNSNPMKGEWEATQVLDMDYNELDVGNYDVVVNMKNSKSGTFSKNGKSKDFSWTDMGEGNIANNIGEYYAGILDSGKEIVGVFVTEPIDYFVISDGKRIYVCNRKI